MAAAATNRYIELAKAIHPRLQRFLAKHPPTQILPRTTRTNNDAITSGATVNPFLPHKHPATGKWQEPEYSLRRQAELVKLAREAGIEELLPFTNKGTEERIRKRVEEGLRVKGTGVGQKVKGHLHERMLATKMEKRRTAILGMPKLVREWRKTGTRKWSKFPSMYHNQDHIHKVSADFQAGFCQTEPGCFSTTIVVLDTETTVSSVILSNAELKQNHKFANTSETVRCDSQKEAHYIKIMAPPPLKKEPSHFEVLSLTPTSLDGQDAPTQSKTVKQAYRRALLKHHPDKNQQAKAQNAPSDPSAASKSTSSKKDDSQHFTVDQITEAFTVLSDSRQRREYIRSLKTQSYTSSSTSSSANQRNASSSATQNYNYHKTFNFTATPAQPQSPSGVETVDLDDVAWDGRKQVYHQTCSRCGTERGYCFRELDLEEVGEDGELMVQCTGCSLWLRVLFEDADDDEDDEDDQTAAPAASGSKEVKQNQGNDLRHVRSGSASGKSGGWSWKFNFGISIGGGASASASAGRG